MARRKGETQQQWMDRLREARGLPPQTRENLMAETRAAVGYINGTNADEATRMSAFMHIFHPGHPKTQELIIAARNTRRF